MPSIQGGGGYLPQPIQPQRQMQQAQAVKAEAPQTELAPKDTLKMQGPTQTTSTSQTAQRLTSDETKSQIHQLIQRAEPQVPQEKPQLQMMQKPAMGSALAEMLKNHHVAEQAPNPQQQAQQQSTQPNQHAQTAAGNLFTSTLVRGRDHTEDSVARNDLQSGKRVRKEEQEGEFSSLEDFGGGGGMSGEGGQDGRSDSQKKKQILTLEEKRKAPTGAKPTQVTAPPNAPKVIMNKTSVTPAPPRPPAPKPAAPKPTIQRVQPPLSQQQKPAPPVKKTDEWTI